MLRVEHGRVPIVVRGCVLVGASVLLGTAAHVGASGGVGVRTGPMMVLAWMLAMAVSAVLGAGAWLAGRVSRWGWSSLVEYVSAGVGLVAGQVLVHWLGQPLPAGLPPLTVGHAAQHGAAAGTVAIHAGAIVGMRVVGGWPRRMPPPRWSSGCCCAGWRRACWA